MYLYDTLVISFVKLFLWSMSDRIILHILLHILQLTFPINLNTLLPKCDAIF